MCYCYCEAEVCSSSVSIRSMFAHSIFKGSPSKEGFHRTHRTSSGSATDELLRLARNQQNRHKLIGCKEVKTWFILKSSYAQILDG